jgi:hypothetical protein
MSIQQTERLIQTYQHSNPSQVIMGTVADASGVVTIDWLTSHSLVFVSKPIIISIYPEGVATNQPYQPICYHQEWIRKIYSNGEWIIDANGLYTGMKVFSEGLGTNIHWAVQGVVKK